MLLSSIRQHILDRAIRGQLVPQRPEEGTAEKLYQQIQAEKKTHKPYATEKTPFAIPKSWKWVKFSQVATIARGGSPRPIKKYLTTDTNGINWIKIGDTEKGGKYINQAHERIIPEGISRSREVHKGDFLLTNSMSYGRPYILNIDGCIHDGWLVFSHYQMAYDKDFLYYLLSSSFAYNQFGEQASGSVVKNLNIDKVANAYFPLPPIAEQVRIVRKIKALFTALDTVESSQKRITAIQTALTKRILEQAIQGQLIPQCPEEGTAEELYQQIQAEKQRLIAAGTIKKEKPLPLIEQKDIPFDLPETWKWVRLSSITYPVGNKNNQILSKEVLDSGDYPAVSQGAALIDGYTNEKDKLITDIPLIMFGDHTRNVKLIDFPFVISADGTKFMKAVIIEPAYLYYWMSITAEKLKNRGYARHFSLLNAEPVPLPPLAEQKRIVAKIEEMLALCKSMQ